MTELTELAARLKAGAQLSAKEVAYVNRILGKLAERNRVAAGYAEALKEGTTLRRGKFEDIPKTANKDEKDVGDIIARELNEVVFRVADSSAQGVKNPDYILGQVVAELYTPTSKGGIDAVLRNLTKKQAQAGVLIVDMSKTALPASDLLAAAPRLWGKPFFGGVTRLIVVQNGKIAGDVARSATAVDASALLRAAATLGAALAPEEE